MFTCTLNMFKYKSFFKVFITGNAKQDVSDH